jgi:hypothetical protein
MPAEMLRIVSFIDDWFSLQAYLAFDAQKTPRGNRFFYAILSEKA